MKQLLPVALALMMAACGQRAAEAPPTEATEPANLPPAQGPGIGAPPQPTQGLPTQPLPAGALVLRRIAVSDPGIIAAGPALHGVIPDGWSAQGGVVQSQGLCSEPYLFDWRATSADGRRSVSLFPTDIWQWSNTQIKSDCRAGEWRSVRDYLAARVQATIPGARILDYRDRPDFAKAAKEAAAIEERMYAQAGLSGARVWAEGGEILYAYEQGGADMRGMAGAVAVFRESSLSNPMAGDPQFDPLGGQPLRAGAGATLGTFAASAPNGALDFTLVEAVRKSFTPDPNWLNRLFALKSAIGQIDANAVKERAAIIVAGGAAATKSNIAAYQAMAGASIVNSNASSSAQRPSDGGMFPGDAAGDRMQRESIEAVRGVETYHDPVDNRRVQLDMNYDHAWRVNNQEAYILTKDPNFNPGQYGIEATQMGVVQ